MLTFKKLQKIFNGRYVEPVKQLLMQGTSPKLIAIGVAGAFVLGLFPVLGSTTLLCTIFALTFRLNLPLVQLVNFSVYPLQIALLIPWMKLGEIVFGFAKLKYSINEIVDLISKDIFHAIALLWNVTMQAIGAWLLFAPIVALLFFSVLYPVLKKIKVK